MIISGFPGTGKSTLCRSKGPKKRQYIDLESSNFHNKSEPNNWEATYIKVAIDLHNQGYCVFISSHYEVRKQLSIAVKEGAIDKKDITVMYPDMSLVEDCGTSGWASELDFRRRKSASVKDNNAYQFFIEHGVEAIEDLENSEFHKIIIDRVPSVYNDELFLDKLISDNLHTEVIEYFE